jgi:protein-L-isoaspartate(D-aspartate) O-methyltransferase
VALEADWPDAGHMNSFVQKLGERRRKWRAFARFPTWMWRNRETLRFLKWLRKYNAKHREPHEQCGVYGLDLYSMYTSIEEVLDYLDDHDAEAAQTARLRYACLEPFSEDPARYGAATTRGAYQSCEKQVVAALKELLKKRLEGALNSDDERGFFNARRNAQLITQAERFYREMYYGGPHSWNLRDEHMFETLESLLAHRGSNARAVVWAHNSHLGDSRATEMSERGQLNLGQLVRETFGDDAYLVGFGTHTGTVAAAPNWGDPMEEMDVRPSLEGSYERLCHDSGVDAFMLPLRDSELRDELMGPYLERAIGVIYRPQTERQSHYFRASLPRQFDEYIWFDETTAVDALARTRELEDEVPDTYPFGY